MAKSKGKTPFQCLLSASRKKSTHLLRSPWRTRTRRVTFKLTPAEKAVKKARRLEEKNTYREALRDAHDQVFSLAEGLRSCFQKHSTDYYLEEIMQGSRLKKNHKNAGSWNAFVSMEVKRINDELPEGVPRKKANELIGQIAMKWHTLSDEEKRSCTKDALSKLQDAREMRLLGSHNVPINAFHDTRVTLQTLEDEIEHLHARTGVEILMIAVRSKKEHFNRPHVVTTSDRISDFIELTAKENVFDLAVRLEAYMLSGVEGVVRNYVQEMCHIRSQLASLIFHKLKETAKGKVNRMYYHNFDTKITEKHGLIIKNWPLKTFCAPSEISSRIELNLLFNAWKSDTAHFYKLTQQEYDEWMERRSMGVAIPDPQPSAMDLDTSSSDSAPAACDPTSTVPSTSTGSIASTSLPTAPTAPVPAGGPLTANFVNVVSGENGSLITVTKKARKQRKDKGVPRKKRGAENLPTS
ncbi:hypothetical protein Hypma_005885 [Hypsizygus marmoreus]|uniref:Uncharacterized protein n=1 Tax=Hypsizygus marmoreus TaxID=39966 RepID=A0A369KBA9_HYPMA|nr:hypothetical protein Hypma_005885 [Hypsizygus marmoreus]